MKGLKVCLRDLNMCLMRKGWENCDCSAWRREGSWEYCPFMEIPDGGAKKTEKLFSVVLSDRARTKNEIWKILLQPKIKTSLLWGRQTLEVVSQRSYGVSICGEIQNPVGHDLGHTAVDDPALSRGVELDDREIQDQSTSACQLPGTLQMCC